MAAAAPPPPAGGSGAGGVHTNGHAPQPTGAAESEEAKKTAARWRAVKTAASKASVADYPRVPRGNADYGFFALTGSKFHWLEAVNRCVRVFQTEAKAGGFYINSDEARKILNHYCGNKNGRLRGYRDGLNPAKHSVATSTDFERMQARVRSRAHTVCWDQTPLPANQCAPDLPPTCRPTSGGRPTRASSTPARCPTTGCPRAARPQRPAARPRRPAARPRRPAACPWQPTARRTKASPPSIRQARGVPRSFRRCQAARVHPLNCCGSASCSQQQPCAAAARAAASLAASSARPARSVAQSAERVRVSCS